MTKYTILETVTRKLSIQFREDLRLNLENNNVNPLRVPFVDYTQLTYVWEIEEIDKLLSIDDFSDKYLDNCVDKMYNAVDWEIFKTRRSRYYPDTIFSTVNLELPKVVDSSRIILDGLGMRIIEGYDIVKNSFINRIDICFKLN